MISAVNGGTIRGTQINMDDFVYDLSHNAAKNFHVGKQDQAHGLKLLKKQNMPSGYIRNNVLRRNYILLNNNEATADKIKTNTPRFKALKKKYGLLSTSSSSSSDEEDFYAKRKKKKLSSYTDSS